MRQRTFVNVNKCVHACIRWVDDSYEVYEDPIGPIGLVKVPKTDAETLYTALCDVCIRCMLPSEKCRGRLVMGHPLCLDIFVELLHD